MFLRDLNQAMLALTTILMYASAVFYRIEQVKDPFFQAIVRLNPVAFFCEESRNLSMRGLPMDWHWYGGVLGRGSSSWCSATACSWVSSTRLPT